MNVETLRELLGRAPFELVTPGGIRHIIKHSEFAILRPSRIVISNPIADRVAVVSLIHLTEARFLSPVARTGS
ncbi:MAG TPA: hypothetical protein VFW73_04930 [Lacipirellulaceae bacterium]|nr:hypothetical protein [Lacipirellulaceae bacterium]